MRDKRIDSIGCVNELIAGIKDPAVEAVKAAMLAKSEITAEGDLYEARLVTGEKMTVDPAKFYELMLDGKMSKARYLEAITVSTSEAKKILSEKDLARVSSTAATSPSLRVTRMSKEPVDIADAIVALQEVAGEAERKKAA